MKRIVFIGSIFIVIIVMVIVQVSNIQKQKKQAMLVNQQYENYKGKDLYGIDVVTIINKATDNNKKYNIPKNEKGMYIEDNENSIKVELNLIADVDSKTNENIMVTKQMEDLQKAGVEGFITNFNLTTFQCKEITYHKKTGKVSKIIVEQVEL